MRGPITLALLSLLAAHAHAAQPFVFGRADLATGTAPAAMSTADFNGDGNPDLAVVNQADNSVTVYFGNINGTFTKSADYPVGNNPSAITVGDFNGDGKPDLAVTNQNCSNTCEPGSVSILLNHGEGTFLPAASYPTGSDPVAIVAVDLNGDGKPDLAVANAITTVGPVAGTVSVLLNSGDGAFQPHSDYPAGVGVTNLSAVVLGNSNVSSIAVTNFSSLNESSTVSILRNHGDGTLGPAVPYIAGSDPVWVASSDFNRDGIADLAIVNKADSTVSILLGRPDGTFVPKTDYAVASGPNRLVVADFNADHSPDLAVTAATRSKGGGAVSVLLGNADGTFQATVTYGTGNDPGAIVSADFNHDGRLDLAYANGDVNRISLLLGNGNGTLPSHAEYSAGTAPSSVAAGDLNGDGLPDLAVTNSGDNTVSIYFGHRDGTFTRAAVYAVGGNPSGVAFGDFNGDRKLDLAVTNSTDNTVSILLNRGDGSLAFAGSYAVGRSPSSIAAADLDGDGTTDLAVTNLADNTVSLLLNSGNALFRNYATYDAGPRPASIVAVALTNNGRCDLVVADSATPTRGSGPGFVSVLRNFGGGVFAAPVDYETGPHPVSVAAGDFDRDGAIDLAVATNLDVYGVASVLLGNGDASFQSHVDYFGGFGLSAVATADFNGDGKLDLALVSTFNDTVELFSGLGDGSFVAQGTYGTGTSPVGSAAGNFAMKPGSLAGADLAVINSASNSVSVFINRPGH